MLRDLKKVQEEEDEDEEDDRDWCVVVASLFRGALQTWKRSIFFLGLCRLRSFLLLSLMGVALSLSPSLSLFLWRRSLLAAAKGERGGKRRKEKGEEKKGEREGKKKKKGKKHGLV